MKEEGFVSRAFGKVKGNEVEARWLSNQAGFNFPDNHVPTPSQKACVAFAACVHLKDKSVAEEESLISRALSATSLGELRAVIDAVSRYEVKN